MKNAILLLPLAFFILLSVNAFSQNTTHSDADTLILMNKEIARKLLKEYENTKELKNDLVPDYSKDWMVTDRPHVAESPTLVPKSFAQLETGFLYQKTKTNVTNTTDITYNTSLIRIGLSRRFEARIEMSYEVTKTFNISNDSVTTNTNGLSGLNLGSKVFLFDGHGIIPKGTLLYGISLPFIGSKEYRPSYSAAEIKFLFLNRINHFYEFEYNVGAQWDGNTLNTAYAYALNNEFELSEKLHCFAELYGYFYENSGSDDRFNGTFTNDHRANAGFWYLFNENLQLDISGGIGLSKISPNYYFAVAFSNRLKMPRHIR
ncbi:MAG: transporter [Cytophagales bacterium]|nr:transporter [Cytophaga sp.]